jgi:hypothetical protein
LKFEADGECHAHRDGLSVPGRRDETNGAQGTDGRRVAEGVERLTDFDLTNAPVYAHSEVEFEATFNSFQPCLFWVFNLEVKGPAPPDNFGLLGIERQCGNVLNGRRRKVGFGIFLRRRFLFRVPLCGVCRRIGFWRGVSRDRRRCAGFIRRLLRWGLLLNFAQGDPLGRAR